MGKPIIRILDSVHCRANKHARALILPCLKYKAVNFRRGKKGYGKNQKIETRYLITGRTGTKGLFLTGLLPRVKRYCKKKGIKISIFGREERIPSTCKPRLNGITFRPDQAKALKIIKRRPRGKILAPTGSGKTILAMGIISMFKEAHVLFLCHTKDLLNQTHKEMRKHFKNIHLIGDGNTANWSKINKQKRSIVISLIQSFSKIDPEIYSALIDLVIVDEEHHVNSVTSQYGKVLSMLLAPRRYGLTATEPTKQKESLVNEGFFGPKLCELTIEEGIKLGIIAKPKVKLIPVPYDTKINIKAKGKYAKYYEYGIAKNRARNLLIANEVKISYNNNKVALVIIDDLEHGKRIQKAIKRVCNIEAPFVYGATTKADRNNVKNQLKKSKLKIAICSKIWKEGINIPSLNIIINALGKKEEKAVLQAMGRGLRTTDDKDTVTLIDFLDPYRYLAGHAILRIQVYSKKGWL